MHFTKLAAADVVDLGLPYDYDSGLCRLGERELCCELVCAPGVLHYGSKAFSHNDAITIWPIPA